MYGVYATIHNAIGFVHEAIVQMGGSLGKFALLLNFYRFI